MVRHAAGMAAQLLRQGRAMIVRRVSYLLVCIIALPALAHGQAPRRAKHVDMRTHGSPLAAVAPADAGADAVATAIQYLRDRAEDLGLTPGDLADLGITSVVSTHTGTTHVYLRQRFGGVDVHGADINVNVTAAREVLGGFGSSFVPNLERAVAAHAPAIEAVDAARNA